MGTAAVLSASPSAHRRPPAVPRRHSRRHRVDTRFGPSRRLRIAAAWAPSDQFSPDENGSRVGVSDLDPEALSAARTRLRSYLPGLDVAWILNVEPRLAVMPASALAAKVVAVRDALRAKAVDGVGVEHLLGAWPRVLLAEDPGETVEARVDALALALPGADVPELLRQMPELVTFPEARVAEVVDRLKAGGRADVGSWASRNPSLLLKLMQSDAAFYYVVDMPAEVTRLEAAKGEDADGAVWTKVGVFPPSPKKEPPPTG